MFFYFFLECLIGTVNTGGCLVFERINLNKFKNNVRVSENDKKRHICNSKPEFLVVYGVIRWAQFSLGGGTKKIFLFADATPHCRLRASNDAFKCGQIRKKIGCK